MSNPDSFIDEVTEEVRRDRLFAMFRRYGWIAVGAVLILVGGAAYNEWRKAQQISQAQALGDAIMAALETTDGKGRVAALDAVEAPDTAEGLVQLLAAGEEVGEGDDAAAATRRLQVMAGNAALPAAYRQLAALKLVLAQGDSVPTDDRRATLSSLLEPGQPYRPLALEQMALLDIEDGNTDAAIATLSQILETPEATAGLRQRATQLIVALGGDPETL